MTGRFADHFSAQSEAYRRFRPGYPPELFEALASLCPSRTLALDVGCGSGQATLPLAERFDLVLASDPSHAQIRHAPAPPNVRYVVAQAETPIAGRDSADLILACQAAHWFDLPRFQTGADRTLKPGGVLALVGYGLMRVAPEIDRVIDEIYGKLLGPDWPPERSHIDSAYRNLSLPYPELPFPALSMSSAWTLDQLLGFFSSWSAVARHRRRTGHDPLPEIARRLAAAWPPGQDRRRIVWPLFARVGRKPRRPTFG